MSLVEEAMVLTGNLYKETNVTPRMISLGINEDLTEAENINLYENALTHSLEKNFRIPLLQGNLLQEAEEEVKNIIKMTVDKGMNDLGEINPSEMATYLPFQNTVKDHVSETLIPDASMIKVDDFVNAQDETYNQFDGNAPEVLAKLDNILNKISTMLSPALFNDKVDMGEDNFDGTKYSMMKAVADMPAPEAGVDGESVPIDDAPETADEIMDPTVVDAGEVDPDADIEAEADAIEAISDTDSDMDGTPDIEDSTPTEANASAETDTDIAPKTDATPDEDDLDNDGVPDEKEPHGGDSDGDSDPVDKDDADKSHAEDADVDGDGDSDKDDKDTDKDGKKDSKKDSKEDSKEGKNPFAKK